MSDGPYKTLPMRPKWKAVAKRAYNAAFTLEQISESIGPALGSDWRNEVAAPLVNALQRVLIGDDQGVLFPGQMVADVQALRAQCASTMDTSLVDAALGALADGFAGQAAMEQAVEGALESRVLSDFRQIEEHVLREGPKGRAAGVRARLEAALPGTPLTALAREILNGHRGPTLQAPTKRDSLDDGVSL